MRDAREVSNQATGAGGQPAQNGILGTVESTVGKAVGCEGMVSEGDSRKPQAGIEEQNGTG